MSSRWAGGVVGLASVLMLAVLVSGCVKNSVVVRVGKDGKGHIITTSVFSREAVQAARLQMEESRRYGGFRGSAKKKDDKEKDPFFNEKLLKASAKKFGPNVKFVKARKFDHNGALGSVAVYAFDDINDVYVDGEGMGQSMQYGAMAMMERDMEDEMMEMMERGGKSDKAIEFKMAKGTPTSKLQIFIPEAGLDEFARRGGMDEDIDEDDADDAKKKDEKDKDEESEDEDEDDPYGSRYSGGMHSMMRYAGMSGGYGGALGALSSFARSVATPDAMANMFKGMRMSVEVEVDGNITSTTSKHVDSARKNRIALMEIDTDKMMASDKAKPMMKKMSRYGSPDAAMGKLINKVPGAMVETNREVTVEFK